MIILVIESIKIAIDYTLRSYILAEVSEYFIQELVVDN